MSNIKQAIQDSVEFLNKLDIEGANYLHPNYPAVVFYFGKTACKYHDELKKDLQRGWGGNTGYVKFFSVSCVSPLTIFDLYENQLDDNAFLDQITDLLRAENRVYSDMSQLLLYCFIDTSDFGDGSEFTEWYMAINQIKDKINKPCQTSLIVLLKDDLKTAKISEAIRVKLLELYRNPEIGEKNNHLYNSVFILSNYLKNGAYTRMLDIGSQSFIDFNLPANLILLSNTKESDLFRSFTAKFVDTNAPAYTASYGLVEKPSREIVLLSLKIAIDSIVDKKNQMQQQTASLEEFNKCIGISNGRLACGDAFFNEIKANFPQNSFVDSLPYQEGREMSLDKFGRLNEVTMGCLFEFIKRNHFRIVEREFNVRRNDIMSSILDNLRSGLTSFQISGLNDLDISKKLTSLNNIENVNVENQPVNQAIEHLVRCYIYKLIIDQIIDKDNGLIKQLKEEADRNIQCFNVVKDAILSEFAIGNAGDISQNGGSKYMTIADRFFKDSNRALKLTQKVFCSFNSDEDILRIIVDELKSLFDSDTIYKKSYIEELQERFVRGNELSIQQYVGEELINDIDSRIEFYSNNVIEDRILEVYFLNTDTGDRTTNLLTEYLKNRKLPRGTELTFFNTSRDDAIETIWFYALSEENLNS